jgi:hypothetical protein
MSRAKSAASSPIVRPLLAAVLRAAVLPAAVVLAGCGGRPSDVLGTPAPYTRPVYELLSETGLYADPIKQRFASDVSPYEPNFALWSDGADKRRWIQLPAGGWIDTTDMDRWRFPVGTRLWKEFSLDGKRLETRLIERYGTEADDWWMGAFVWDDAGSDAVFVEDGERDLLGTSHDAPSQQQCGACHSGEPGRVLGFSALQLPRGDEPGPGSQVPVRAGAPRPEVTLARLVAADWLSEPPPSGAHYGPPGDDVTAQALGYLHANCGHCHNPWAMPWGTTHLLLRLDVENVNAEDSPVFQSLVGAPLDHFEAPDLEQRVSPGEPDRSAILKRMEARGGRAQMPPLATEAVDEHGIDLVRRWVESLSE